MTIAQTLNKSLRSVKRNSPELLAITGVIGVLSTAYLAARAGYKAANRLKSEDPDDSVIEKTKKVWTLYIPPTVSGVLTAAAIVGSNKASGARTAAAVAAYSFTEKAFSEYKENVVEQLGKNKEQKIRDDIAQQKVTDNPPDSQVVMLGKGEVMCCELWTGRYFKSDMESLRRAENEINAMVNNSHWVVLSDLYDILGLRHTSKSNNLGWDSDKLLSLEFSTVMSPDGEPCLAFDYNYLRPSDRQLYM